MRIGILLAFAAALPAGCVNSSSPCPNPQNQCSDFWIAPTAAMLKGDTMPVIVNSRATLFLGALTWTVTGAAQIIQHSEAQSADPWGSSSSILVHAPVTGNATVTASDTSGWTASMALRIADSTAIARIDLRPGWPYSKVTVRLGDSLWIAARLFDAGGVEFHGTPDLWSSANSSIGSLGIPPRGGVWLRGHSQGSTVVTAGFLGLRQTVNINVVP